MDVAIQVKQAPEKAELNYMTEEMSKVVEDSARGSFFLVTGSMLSTVISAIASILVARFLEPEGYGQYTLALVIPQILFMFADLGINQGLIKFSASSRARGETKQIAQMIKYGMLLRALIGAIIFIVAFAFAEQFAVILLNRQDLGVYMKIASFSIIFDIILATATSAFVGLDRTEYSALTTNVQAVAKGIISISLVLLGLSVAGAVIGHVAGSVIAGIAGTTLLFLLLKRHFNSKTEGDMSSNLKTLITYGMPLYMSALVAGIVLPYQNLVLANFVSDADIGNFKATTNFVALISIVSAPITTALLPAFSKLNSTSNGKIKEFYKLANKYTSLLIIPTAVLIMVFSKEIVWIIYGSTYQSASLFLLMYCPLYFLVGIGYLTLSSLFNGLGETRIVLRITLIQAVIFVLLAPVLVLGYDVPGLITALLASQTLATSYGAFLARTKFRIEFASRAIIKICLASAISSIPALLLLQLSPMPILLKVLAGGLVYIFSYATLIPLARVITFSELDEATRILQRIKPLRYLAKPLLKYEKKILSYQA